MLLCIFGVSSVNAQEVKERGNNAVTIGAAANTASIGYWHKLSDQISLGGDFTVVSRDHNEYDSQSYKFAPGIKYYLEPEKAVSPYLYGAMVGEYDNSKSDQSVSSSRSEWFPTQRVSIAGHVGVIAQYEKHNSSYTSGPFGSTKDEGYTVGTISSGILLNLYF